MATECLMEQGGGAVSPGPTWQYYYYRHWDQEDAGDGWEVSPGDDICFTTHTSAVCPYFMSHGESRNSQLVETLAGIKLPQFPTLGNKGGMDAIGCECPLGRQRGGSYREDSPDIVGTIDELRGCRGLD